MPALRLSLLDADFQGTLSLHALDTLLANTLRGGHPCLQCEKRAGITVAPSYSEIFAAKEKNVTSPDGRITVNLAGGRITDAYFAAGAYSSYRESDLELQVASLIKLAIVARKRSRREAMKESMGHDLVPRRLSSKDKSTASI